MNDELSFRTLVVTKKDQVAEGIFRFELRDEAGPALPPFTAGAHLTVRVPSGANRNYSLCNDPDEADRYVIAVKRDAAGRGGSLSMTDDVAEGDRIEVSEPRNEFGLSERARSFVFVAGGIGITPILSMMRHLKATAGPRFKLYYVSRSPETTAFIDELSSAEWKPHVVIHHDHGDLADAFDFWPVFEKPGSGAHVYCCGPRALMDGVRDMTGHWPTGSVHFESFGVDQSRAAENTRFSVKLERSGRWFEIPKDRSILEILRDNGIRAPSSCESGTCGSCRTTLCAGEADHRDMVLGDDEKRDQIMICVSRAKSEELVLDL
ncbi:PDR/VanB family oxidoreductase [Caballeronia grimmiae]|uniref:Iron-sulfur protein n=1 Tax=Caballeronia grimmiae TaxID=1071679 RepID=A0A069NG40_9BURK|nr:PDR/VanB family oxidoreductase [Caballeronia grimmiae]KDR27388.1 phthalate 4,5-dioxygenase [Caballeronia grimmiae]GGD74414.1 iron-sulfur protein [Caballeronia grimmiae]